ncbi:MAG: RDD family protein [Defluviitaleaceae bacterium]|nr:RDD family protein [Defluviitaleaceae bacterium]
MDNHGKLGNIGILTDISFAKYKSNFAQYAAFIGFISVIFAISIFVIGWVSLVWVWPAIPNFTGNQPITDGIVLGVFSVLMLFVVAFFLAWYSAASIIICANNDTREGGQLAPRLSLKDVTKSAFLVVGVLFANILIFMPFLAIIALAAATNLSSIQQLAMPLLSVLYFVFVALRTLFFFASNLASRGEYRFLSAFLQSMKMVAQKGIIRIFAVTTLITSINFGIFFGLFIFLLVIFSQYPTDLLGFLEILVNPLGVVALLFLAHLVAIFVTPKIQILAYIVLNSSGGGDMKHEQPNLASRTLATVLDLAIVAGVFGICFYGTALLASGGVFMIEQMNFLAVVITIIAYFAVYTIYNIYFESFGGGQTLGKRIFGLVVRDHNGGSLNLVQSLVRNVLRIVDIFGFVAIAFNKEHRRLGDMLSLAVVEYEGGKENVS